MPRHFSRAAQLALSSAVALFPSSTRATAISWSTATSGSWTTAAKWTPASVPTSADSVTINASGTYTVTLPINGSAYTGPFTLNAPNATLDLSPGSMVSAGALTISAGTLAIHGSQSTDPWEDMPQIYSTSFINAGNISFNSDLDATTPYKVFASINTGSGAVLNSGTIETHPGTHAVYPPTSPSYSPTYTFTGNPGATFTNTGTLRALAGSILQLNRYTLNQNAGLLDRGIDLESGTLNYNGGTCPSDIPTYLGNSALKIAPTATGGNFILADTTSTITSNIPAGNTVYTWGTAPVKWTGTGSTFSNAGHLIVGSYPSPSSTTATPSFSVGSSFETLLNTGTADLNSPNLPATSFTGSIKNQGTFNANTPNTTYSKAPTTISGNFTQNSGSLTISPSTSLAISLANFYFNGGVVSGTVSLVDSTVTFAPTLSAASGVFQYTSTKTNDPLPFSGGIPVGATFVHSAPTGSNPTTSFVFSSFKNAGTLNTAGGLPTYILPYDTKTLTNTGSFGGTVGGVDHGISLNLTGNLTNTGNIKSYRFTLSTGTFNQNAGTIDVDTYCGVSQGTFNYSGGTLTGKPIDLNASNLNIAPNTNPASFNFSGGLNNIVGSPALGSSLSLDPLKGSSTISVTAPSFTNAASLSLAATAYTATSTLTVTTGTPAKTGTITNTGTLSVTNGKGGTRTLNANVANSGTFSIGPSATLTYTGTLTTSTPLDLQGALLLTPTSSLTFTDASAAPNTIRTLLSTSHITSTGTDATHRLAYSPAPDGSLRLTLSLAGDANLNGRLDPDDFALLDQGYARHASTWYQGDFNYDGAVDQADYLLLDTTLGKSQGFSPGFLEQRESQFGPTYVSTLLTSLPEPTSLLAAIGVAFPALRRRKPGEK